MTALIGILFEKSISSILLEGGATLSGAMVREKLVDKYYIFNAPKILGGDDGIPMLAGTGPTMMDQSMELKDVHVRRFENDTLIWGYPDYSKETTLSPG